MPLPSRAERTTERMRRGALPAPTAHSGAAGLGDGRPCDGCGDTIHPTEKRWSVVVQVAREAVEWLLVEQLARVETLQRQLGRVIPFVFPHLTGPHRGERTAEFRKAWRRACTRAGLPGLLVHDLRRSAVRNMERGGVSRSVAMKITGHKTESVYRRYAIVSDVDLQDAATKIGTLAGTLTGSAVKGAR